MSQQADVTGNHAAVAFVGFGEAASAFVAGWTEAGIRPAPVAAYDIKTDTPDTAAAKRADYEAAGIAGMASLEDALRGALLVFSMVTADQSFAAASRAAECLAPDAFFLDCNSVSPDTKRRAAEVIAAAGGRYVDTAVMAPVYPARHRTPLLLSGPHAEAVLPVLAGLDANAEAVGDDVGTASSVKMIRSVMVKGLEALVLECVLSARAAGVDERVLDSLEATYPGFGWRERAAYMMERVTTHGIRRAAEMRESARTVRELGFSGAMTDGTVDWQQLVGDLKLSPGDNNYGVRADAILTKLREEDT